MKWKITNTFAKMDVVLYMEEITINLKFYGYQILGVFIIWLGMLFFFSDLFESGKIIFYIVTSWLLFLIVLFVKQYVRERNK
ncbi:hypothetical protein ACLIBH_10355 [Virgibacillus sp. W0430]|uniref:hypothetical protein n=1 Tax=Virgibacillus sp. W0430 TaxID=3391580 RepID=UPI003F45E2FA